MSRSSRNHRIIDSTSTWVGSWWFFWLHMIWFGTWLVWGNSIEVLTLIVSLEAIILMLLLLMQQNRQVRRDERREEKELTTSTKDLAIGEQTLAEIKALRTELTELARKLDHASKDRH